MFKAIDVENWERKSTFDLFKDYEDPFFNITAMIDATSLYLFCKQNDVPFSLGVLFCSLETANNIKEFRFRLHGGEPVEFKSVHANQTILNDDNTFSFCYFERQPDIFEFAKAGKAAISKYKKLRSFEVESERIDMIYYSVIPWVSFTSFKHARKTDNTETVPRIVFGKFIDDGAQKKMPVSVEVHHAMMDGYHVGRYFNELQMRFDQPV